ncbi:hypothetical protein E2C01_023274 [Portunus trituberculatus]|uniref:Uncharacterized protein n=1 Tax=Portunus trituberculatus TaxID=210409 RepID=A0A5B7E7J6_PORTR|nr:hypothetical protein [Portunus trituberculatus]
MEMRYGTGEVKASELNMGVMEVTLASVRPLPLTLAHSFTRSDTRLGASVLPSPPCQAPPVLPALPPSQCYIPRRVSSKAHPQTLPVCAVACWSPSIIQYL